MLTIKELEVINLFPEVEKVFSLDIHLEINFEACMIWIHEKYLFQRMFYLWKMSSRS